jgi:hypothetical protein
MGVDDFIRTSQWEPSSSLPLTFCFLYISGFLAWHLLTCWFLLTLFLRPWRWRRYVPPKRRLQLNRLHGVISQKMILFTALTIVNTIIHCAYWWMYAVFFIFHRICQSIHLGNLLYIFSLDKAYFLKTVLMYHIFQKWCSNLEIKLNSNSVFSWVTYFRTYLKTYCTCLH